MRRLDASCNARDDFALLAGHQDEIDPGIRHKIFGASQLFGTHHQQHLHGSSIDSPEVARTGQCGVLGAIECSQHDDEPRAQAQRSYKFQRVQELHQNVPREHLIKSTDRRSER
jgi:hypothetical protein